METDRISTELALTTSRSQQPCRCHESETPVLQEKRSFGGFVCRFELQLRNPAEQTVFDLYKFECSFGRMAGLWRDGRVADCAALEMLCPGNRTGGSNPPLSAQLNASES